MGWRRALSLAAAVTAAAWGAGSQPAGAHAGHPPAVVNIGGGAFSPASVTVYIGDYVFWSWTGPDYDHSVTLTDPNEAFDSDPGKSPSQVTHGPGDGYAHLFTHPGTYTYFDKVHPSITGTVSVQTLPGSTPLAPAAPPVISGVRMQRPPCRRKRRRCPTRAILLSYRLTQDATMRADVDTTGTPAGTVMSIDFLGRRGANRQRVSLGRLARGRFQLILFATNSSGYTSAPKRLPLRIQ